MPNIAAFLAWGLITALFAPGGWLPNARLAALIEPMLSIQGTGEDEIAAVDALVDLIERRFDEPAASPDP